MNRKNETTTRTQGKNKYKYIMTFCVVLTLLFVNSYADTTYNFLTKGQADGLYCSQGGGCAGGGGSSGMNESFTNDTYFRLDALNSPITSGFDIVANPTNTSNSGALIYLDAPAAINHYMMFAITDSGTRLFSVDEDGDVFVKYDITINNQIRVNKLSPLGTNTPISFNVGGRMASADKSTVKMCFSDMEQSTGTRNVVFELGPIYQQSGDASGIDLLIDRKNDTGIGSGEQLLIRAGMDGVSRLDLFLDGRFVVGNQTHNINSDQYGNLNVTGNLNVSGNITGNLIYGEIYNFSHSGVVHSIAAADEYINITYGTVPINLNGFTFSGGKLTATITGIYRVFWGMSFNGGNADEYHGTVGINGHGQSNCHAVRDAGSSAKTGAVSRSCSINVVAGDIITFMVENDNDDDDVTIDDFNMNIMLIGR